MSSVQDTKPSGGFLRWTLRSFLGSSPALASALWFSTTWSGAWTTTAPDVSNPARPARPAIWWNSRALSTRWREPSNLVSPVKTTVRIGTLMPTPRVSVPQMTLSRPAWARVSTSRRYFGSMPAWWTPIPCRTRRERVFPNPGLNRKPPISSAIRSFSSRVQTLMLVRAWARSSAAAWVKCTTYTGAWWVCNSSSRVSWSGVSAQVWLRGTGRSTEVTTAVSRPVRRVRSSTNLVTSPRVADISTNWACGRVSSGTCQAQPRSGSE